MKFVPAKQTSILLLLMAFAIAGCHKQTAAAPTPATPAPAPVATAPAPQPAPAPSASYTPRPTPTAAPAPTLTAAQLFAQTIKDTYFAYDKADLSNEDQTALENDAAFLRAHPEIKVTIEGHCDERGGEEYNLALGDRRAVSTRQFLEAQGIPDSRIQTVSLGKEHPFCTEENESCYQQNRRGHFVMAP